MKSALLFVTMILVVCSGLTIRAQESLESKNPKNERIIAALKAAGYGALAIASFKTAKDVKDSAIEGMDEDPDYNLRAMIVFALLAGLPQLCAGIMASNETYFYAKKAFSESSESHREKILSIEKSKNERLTKKERFFKAAQGTLMGLCTAMQGTLIGLGIGELLEINGSTNQREEKSLLAKVSLGAVLVWSVNRFGRSTYGNLKQAYSGLRD